MGRKYHKVIKKVVISNKHFFQNIDFIGFEKDTLKVCSQKFVKTIDKDKSICYNKAKLRDRNKKTKKAENEYKK